jgi:RNA polymerase sigma factor (TIGR02999 family)
MSDDELIPAVYGELRRLARKLLSAERGNVTLRTNDLVHEAWERLFGGEWQGDAHFLRAAAQAMRRILVDRARARNAQKRGGHFARISFSDAGLVAPGGDLDIERLGDALDRLEALDPRQARIVELRFFAGCSVEETARALDLSPATIKREWRLAKAWLYREIVIA